MSDISCGQEVRARVKTALTGAGLALTVDRYQAPVKILDQPPAGWQVAEKSLPALYVFTPGERLIYDSVSSVSRLQDFDIALMSPLAGDPMDHLDFLQLSVERALYASALDPLGLGGVVSAFRLQSVQIGQDQGRSLFSVRLLRYVAEFGTAPGDPSA